MPTDVRRMPAPAPNGHAPAAHDAANRSLQRSVAPVEQLLLNARETAAVLGVALRTLARLNSSGAIPPPIRLGGSVRWRAEELVDWCRASCPPRSEWKWEPNGGSR